MNYKKPYYISLTYLIGLLIGSFIFYKERMLFVDPAFITFEIIQNQTFIFSEHRYGAFITQIFPLISSYFKASLHVVLLLYSVSFYIFYLFVVTFSGSVLKQKLLAILFVFYLCFFVSDVYFWPNNEIHQSAGWMILFLSLLNFAETKQWKVNRLIHVFLVSTLFLSIISHLLILIPLTFLWCYSLIENQRNSKQLKYFLYYSIIILLFAGLRYYLSFNSWYDGVKLQGIKQISFESILNALRNDHSISISKLLVQKYWVFLLVSITGLATLLYKKKKALAALTILYSALFYLLVVLTYPEKITENNLFYFESQWMCLSLIACAPFLYETIKYIGEYKITIVLFVLIFMLKIPQLNTSLTKFRLRLFNLQTLVEDATSNQLQKSYIYNSEELDKTLLQTWGLPVETALLSSLKNRNESITIKTFNRMDNISTSNDSIYTSFNLLPISKVNSEYFSFSNKTNYKILYK